MTVRIDSTVLIDRPVEDVYALVLDFEQIPTWDPDTQTVVKITEGPVGVGTKFQFEQDVRGKRRTSTTRITALEPNRTIDAEAQIGPKFSPMIRMTFTPEDGRTRLTVQGEGEPRGVLKLMSRPMTRMGKRIWDRRLDHLRSYLEAQARGSA